MKRAWIGATLALFLGGLRPATADFVLYDFTDTTGAGATVTVDGSFLVDLLTIQNDSGQLTGSDVQSPSFTASDGVIFDTLSTLSTLRIDSSSLDLTSADLSLTSSTNSAYSLQIDGSSLGNFTWTESAILGEVLIRHSGTGTFSDSSEASAVPAPSGLTLFGIGAVCSLAYGWRRRKLARA